MANDDACCGGEPVGTKVSGGVVAYEGDLPSVKALGARCEAAGIGVRIGPSPGKG